MTTLEIQQLLNKNGYKLTEDGIDGAKTTAAIVDFQTKNKLTPDGLVGTKTVAALMKNISVCPSPTKKRLRTELEIIKDFGQPGDTKNFTIITCPYKMRIAWDLNSTITKIQCHKKIAEPLLAVFTDLLAAYGYEELKRLDIDLYGGCYAFRKKRGGTTWSHHSWAIAIDLSPEKNSLNQHQDTAQFAKVEYEKMQDIFYKHGFVGLGREKDYDFMHFEYGI